MQHDSARIHLLAAVVAAEVLLAILGATVGKVFAVPLLLAPGCLLAFLAIPPAVYQIPERLVMMLGVAISVIVLLGLGLNLLAWGLQQATWALGLGMAMIVLTLLGAPRLWPEHSSRRWRLPVYLQYRRGWLAVLAASLITLAVLLGNHADATVQRGAGFTQFWMLPDGTGGAYLGMISDERGTERYDIVLRDGSHILRHWWELTLQPGQRWQVAIRAAELQGIHGQIEAQLYRPIRPYALYRYATLWLGNAKG
jgi:hypothetical protein